MGGAARRYAETTLDWSHVLDRALRGVAVRVPVASPDEPVSIPNVCAE